eukprot:scaffold2974_cov119-Isochrysis_galbana.AAC.4
MSTAPPLPSASGHGPSYTPSAPSRVAPAPGASPARPAHSPSSAGTALRAPAAASVCRATHSLLCSGVSLSALLCASTAAYTVAASRDCIEQRVRKTEARCRAAWGLDASMTCTIRSQWRACQRGDKT